MILTEDEKKELIRLLFIASMTESDRMNEQGVQNALFFIKKLKENPPLTDTHANWKYTTQIHIWPIGAEISIRWTGQDGETDRGG